MFNRALNWFTNYSAQPATEFESTPSLSTKEEDVETPLLSTAAPMVDEDNLLSTAAPLVDEEDNLETPLLPTRSHVVLESPTLSSSVGSSIVDILKNPKCERLIICLVFLILFGIAVYHFVVEVNRISDELQLDSVLVSSFNVSKNFPETTWDTELSLTLSEGDFDDLDVRYEAPRLWLYSRDGFVSMTTPSLEYSLDGKKLIMHGVFSGMRRDIKGEVVSLGMLMETNAMRRINIHVSEVEIKALVMIDCNDLKIEFDALNKRFGTLKDGAKCCKVHVCPLEPHPLYDGADKCTTSSSSSIPSSNLENF